MFNQNQPSEPQLAQPQQDRHPQAPGSPQQDHSVGPRLASQDNGAKPDQFAAKFQQLSAREKQLRDLETQLKERDSKVRSFEEAMKLANDDPFKLLESLNLDVERLYEVKKGGGKFNPGELQVRQLKSELEKMREQLAARDQAEQEAKQNAERERALAEFTQNVAQSLQSSDKHELAKARGGTDDVLGVLSEHYAKTGEMLDINQAIDIVEQRYEEEAKKLLQTNKLKQWFSELTQSSQNNEGQAPSNSAYSGARTLTNSMTTQTAPRSEGTSPEERFRQAVEILQGRRA